MLVYSPWVHIVCDGRYLIRSCLVCGVQRDANNLEKVIGVIPIAGGEALDARWSRLSDIDEDGLRVELHGGYYPTEGRGKRKQMAIIEFYCDLERTGLNTERFGRREEGENEDENKKDLTFVKYDTGNGDTDV